MDYLDELESQSIYIMREAYKKFKKIGMLWSIGKDSILGDSTLYYRINGELGYGTIEDLYAKASPERVIKESGKEFMIPTEKIEVLTLDGDYQENAKIRFGRVSTLISHEVEKDIYQITLRTNRQISTTGDHSLIARGPVKGKGVSIKAVETRKLSRKDAVFCVRDYCFDNKEIKKHNTIKVDDDLLLLGGLWLADGCYALDRKIIISTGGNKGIIQFLKKLPRIKPVTEKIAIELSKEADFDGKHLPLAKAKKIAEKHDTSFWAVYDSKKRLSKLLNRKIHQYVKVNDKGDAWICSKAYVAKLKRLGFTGKGSEKKIPSWIYNASNRQIAVFLSGYFAGDGSCWLQGNRTRMSFSGMNKTLITGLRPLLWRLGIDHAFSSSNARKSGFRTRNKKIHQIIISQAESIKNFYERIHDVAGKFKDTKINWKPRSKYPTSTRTVQKIRKLPNKKRIVFDLEVESTQNFIANGVVCHNSTTMIGIARKAFYGLVPFPVIYIDTGKHFKEMYEFRDKCVEKWDLNLIVSRNEEADAKGIGPKDKIACCDFRKTQALKKTLAEHKFDALILGIRRDEHGIRAKERVFSPRDKDFAWNYKDQAPELWDQYKTKLESEFHLRIHPLLAWTELDIWEYIKRENLPVNPLYFSGARFKGKRFRSLGCETCTEPVESRAGNIDEMIAEIKTTKISERAGRAQDKEEVDAMQKLRALGYM